MKIFCWFPLFFLVFAYEDVEIGPDKSVSAYYKGPKPYPLNCPWTSIVTIDASPDLPTQIWEYSTVYSVARYTGLDPYIPPMIFKKLSLIFKGLTIPSFVPILHCHFNQETFVYKYSDWNNMEQSLYLPRGAIELPLIMKYFDALLDQFQLTNEFQTASQKAIQRTLNFRNTDTIIGIYINKGDFEYLSSIPEAMIYYNTAVDYFRDEFGNVTFIAMCGTSPICTDKFSDLNDIYVYKFDNIERLDIAILSLCDHVIFRNGGIGLWGGLLAGGKIAYDYCGELFVNAHGDETIIQHLVGTKRDCSEKSQSN